MTVCKCYQLTLRHYVIVCTNNSVLVCNRFELPNYLTYYFESHHCRKSTVKLGNPTQMSSYTGFPTYNSAHMAEN